MKNKIFYPFLLLLLSACGPSDGLHSLYVLCTNDVHGRWFDSSYVDASTRQSLMSVNWYVDSVRSAAGAGNVLLLDSGDCLQGDNAAYYYNYVESGKEHLFTRLVSYMGYDAITVGNHDIETGHPVYDRVNKELRSRGIPFLAGNAFRNDGGKPYFTLYKCFKRAGLKVLVLGYTNPNMSAWLDEELWKGMHFGSLLPLVQEDVDRIRAKEKPDVVIVSVHSATGKGDGSILEAQGLDLFKSLRGVDLLLCSHDHRELVVSADSIALVNTGNRAKFLGHTRIDVNIKDGKKVSAHVFPSLLPIDRNKVDTLMRARFRDDYEAVRDFTVREIGALATDLRTRDAYSGMSAYIGLLHTVQLKASGAQISFAAPLTYNGKVSAGVLLYNDLFTIYPFENQLFRMRMKGSEIKDYLEYSYNLWLAPPESGHVLNIVRREDPRNNQGGWSFAERPYNFDSAAGLRYTVDVSKPFGSRISIESLADGSPFDPGAEYSVAMTSYRANGGGDLLVKGAGIPKDELGSRVEGKFQEVREFIYGFIKEYGLIDEESVSDPSLLGHWEFVPSSALELLDRDVELLFGK